MSLFSRTDPSEQLLTAASNVDVAQVQKALSRKADPNAREEAEGQTALHLCIRGRKGQPQHGALGTVRAYCPVEDIEAIVDLLLCAGTNVNTADSDGLTALHWASGYGFVKIIHSLIQAGASVDAADNLGITPLHQAADSGAKDAAEMLLDAGAVVNRRTNDGRTALAIAEGKKVLGGGQDLMEPFRQMLRQRGATL